MTNFLRKLYVGTKEKMNNLIKNEEGSTAVEFMGIAAVAVVIIMLVTTYMGDGGGGGNLITSLIDIVVGGITGLFKF